MRDTLQFIEQEIGRSLTLDEKQNLRIEHSCVHDKNMIVFKNVVIATYESDEEPEIFEAFYMFFPKPIVNEVAKPGTWVREHSRTGHEKVLDEGEYLGLSSATENGETYPVVVYRCDNGKVKFGWADHCTIGEK